MNQNLKLDNMIFGKLKEPFTSNLDPEVAEAYEIICDKLENLGATIENYNSEANEKQLCFRNCWIRDY